MRLNALLPLSLALLATPALQAEELPKAVQQIQAKGAVIKGSFDAPNGLRGYAAEYQNNGIALYLTPDGKHVLVGSLFDEQGKDLSAEPLEKLVYAPMTKAIWAKMEKTAWIADGKANAPRIVYLFSDPNCPYCNMFWQQARPWVESGKVQLRHIMVGIIREDSPGKSAALLAAKDPAKALEHHEKAGKASTLKALDTIPEAVQTKLEGNLAFMEELGLRATPAIFYQDEQGNLQSQQGAPRPEMLGKILGKR
ncbi:thiol:disulfide interchange protein DsbG [Pseudomonas guariconensis]|uniref:thiol:disulfide interchange protein DsbG n=1 Tax=Pseudomonas TaxID=286 RepID=UPI0020975B7C|nr:MULTISPECIES: thiol:disulfide interchange protein DsbG [Pseudomonas]MCO7636976.1 thiol:disulfide interchange protein DsbG [Pseudomonas sp. S 311-6]MCO7514842.1 thiol:disulfide interchange protein DsbG [Pseudomonas putida]MCO7564882.1 thiol:disulfide interchange protein DsbG [Pseudomonas mosselii]MCO7606522.1 thiol:disulfide interchange protein DsbG [Pseudomonas guariconensis]MCO7616384.1 thiol:disulfide interchange protein DsbG [Pseudomonas guariconensis]